MYYQTYKRLFDVTLAAFLTILFLPLILIVAVLIKLDSAGPVFFRQARTGRFEKSFNILKFRTMHHGSMGLNITVCGDRRITRIGRVLRKTKLDEIPQLINVLFGDMSIIGPRPQVHSDLVHYDRTARNIIFSSRPGMTDLASLLYIHEERLLAESNDPMKTYFEVILPEKNRLRMFHLLQESFVFDIKILILTGLKIVFRQKLPFVDSLSHAVSKDTSSTSKGRVLMGAPNESAALINEGSALINAKVE